jgi:hypothetical protein
VSRQRLVAANDVEVAATDLQAVALACECGDPACRDAVVVTPSEHSLARGLRARIVSLEHAVDDGGRVIAVLERFALVLD